MMHSTDRLGQHVNLQHLEFITHQTDKACEDQGRTLPCHWIEPAVNQGFYPQDQIKELVAYDDAWKISIVPEFEIPWYADGSGLWTFMA